MIVIHEVIALLVAAITITSVSLFVSGIIGLIIAIMDNHNDKE